MSGTIRMPPVAGTLWEPEVAVTLRAATVVRKLSHCVVVLVINIAMGYDKFFFF